MKNTQEEINELKTLDMLRKGEVAIITGLIDSFKNKNCEIKNRLLELGFVPGEKVKVIAESFPQYDPFVVKVGNTNFALRRQETSIIKIENQ